MDETEEQPTEYELHDETVEFIAGYAERAVADQLAVADTMATRGYQAIAFGSAVIGIAAGTAGSRGLLWAAAAVYAGAAVATAATVWPRTFARITGPKSLWETSWYLPKPSALKGFIEASIEAHGVNAKSTRKRSAFLKATIVAVGVETILVILRATLG